tara:strand:- start:1302 stop:1886 length:585 start_codon:yes stop_codon:yes gene_type:complete
MIYFEYMENIKKTSRLTIFKELINTNTSVQFSYTSITYRVPMDDLYDFLAKNTNVLKTSSWIDRGIYNWPRPTKKLLTFLQNYVVVLDDEDEKEDGYWFSMLEKLREYRLEHGHCYIPSDYNQTSYGVQNPLVTWTLKTRSDYLHNRLDSRKISLLDEIDFLKWTTLKQYFKPENVLDRRRLIQALNNIKTNYK